jgi:hypothetical protein
MNPTRSRPALDPSIIRRPGQAAPVAAPVYAASSPREDDATPARSSQAAPAGSDQGFAYRRSADSMPWLKGKPWTRKLGIRVDEDRVRRIKIVAAARGTTMEALLVQAIDEHMDRHWPDVSQQLK